MGEVYDRLKAAAKEKGLTITGIEKQLGIARGSLSKIDNHKPSAEKATKLAELLGIPVEELTPGGEKKKTKTITAVFHKHNVAFGKEYDKLLGEIVDKVIDTILTPFEWELLACYRVADPGTRAAVRKLLDVQDEDTLPLPGEDFDGMPIAAHEQEGAAPDELAEDVEMVKDDKI